MTREQLIDEAVRLSGICPLVVIKTIGDVSYIGHRKPHRPLTEDDLKTVRGWFHLAEGNLLGSDPRGILKHRARA